MNFEHGIPLADFQESLIQKFLNNQVPTRQEYLRLINNKWVSLANRLAPCNLVIRHYCLIDLIQKTRNYKDDVDRLVDILTCHQMPNDALWAESYSYWLYTKPVLSLYLDDTYTGGPFNYTSDIITKIDLSFAMSGYRRNGVSYPAPFGDLRDVPLEQYLQVINPMGNCSMGPITKTGDTYVVKATPLGFNLHVPIEDKTYRIVDGVPEGFKWYEGYDKKYGKPGSEFFDLINKKRLLSLEKSFLTNTEL